MINIASGNIKGITIEIGGDTKNLEQALSNVSKESKSLQAELKQIERGLKFDPGNVTLVAQRQQVLAQTIEETSKRLDVLKGAQAQVQAQFERGEIGADQYRAFQRELETTQNSLNRYQTALGSIQGEQTRLQSSTNALGTLFQATGTNVDQFANVLGTRLTRAIKDGSASADQINRAIGLIGREALGSEVDVEELNVALRQIDDGGNIDDVRRDLSRLTNEADQSGEAVNGFGQKLSGIAGTFAKVAAGSVVAVGAIGAAVFGLSAPLVRAAGDLQALNAQFDIVFGELGKQATESLNNIGEQTGVATGRLKATFTQIAAFAKTSGADTATALDISSRATLAAADSAAFYDKSIEEVAESLQSFLKGNFANDAALGISATEFTRNAAALDQFGKKYNDLTELQKQETLLKLVEDGNKLGGALGQAARETDGLENVLGNLKDAYETLKAALGDQIFDIAIDGIKRLTDFINNFDLQPFFDAFGRFKEAITNVLDTVLPFIQDRLTQIRMLWSSEGEGILSGITFVFNAIKSVIEQVLNAVLPFIQSQLSKLKKYWDENGQQILQAATIAFNGIKAIIDFIMPAILFVIDYVWTAIKNVITGSLDVILGVVKVFSSALNGDFSGLWEGIKQIFSGAIDLILGLMSLSFVGGIRKLVTDLFKNLVKTVKTNWTAISTTFKEFSTSIPRTVSQLSTSVINFFRNLQTTTLNIVINLAKGIFNAIKGLPGQFLTIGKNITQGLINGIKSLDVVAFIKGFIGNIIDVAKSILGIKSPSRVFREIGMFTGQGLAQGIDSTQNLNQKAIADLNKVIINEATKNASSVSEIAKKAEEERTKIQKKYAEQRAKAGETYANATAKKAVSSTKKTAKQLEAANKSYNDKVVKANTTRSKKLIEIDKKEAEELKKINDKAFADIQKKQAEVDKNTLDALQKFISNKKSLNELSLIDEAEYRRVAYKLAKDGTEERKTLLKDYQDTVNTINDKITSTNESFVSKAQKINDDLIKGEEDLNAKYKSALDSRYNTLVSAYGLFDEVASQDLVDPTILVQNLEAQVNALQRFQNSINTFRTRGISGALLEDLQNLGPKANAELEALNRLTDAELQRYAETYETRSRIARETAVKELEPLAKDTEVQIQRLRDTANKDLQALNTEWQAQIKKVIGGTEEQFKTLNQVGKNAAQNLLDGLTSVEPALLSKSKQIASDISKTISDALNLNGTSTVNLQTNASNLNANSQKLTSAVSNAQASLNSSATQSNNNQAARTVAAQSNNIDMASLVAAIGDLASRPIQTAVQLNGQTIANSTSQYQNSNYNVTALQKGVTR